LSWSCRRLDRCLLSSVICSPPSRVLLRFSQRLIARVSFYHLASEFTAAANAVPAGGFTDDQAADSFATALDISPVAVAFKHAISVLDSLFRSTFSLGGELQKPPTTSGKHKSSRFVPVLPFLTAISASHEAFGFMRKCRLDAHSTPRSNFYFPAAVLIGFLSPTHHGKASTTCYDELFDLVKAARAALHPVACDFINTHSIKLCEERKTDFDARAADRDSARRAPDYSSLRSEASRVGREVHFMEMLASFGAVTELPPAEDEGPDVPAVAPAAAGGGGVGHAAGGGRRFPAGKPGAWCGGRR
jgi:hypothetical protein